MDNEKSEQARRDLKIDLEEMNAKLTQLEEELYGSKTEQLDLLQQLKDLEFDQQQAIQKIQQLQEENQSLYKNQAIYIGKRHDKIDMALANYFNTYPEKQNIRILFLRESEGVYQFGQKRVYIKIEQGNQIKVRVGGGFMHIDEFIDQYSEAEVEKIGRKDPIQRF